MVPYKIMKTIMFLVLAALVVGGCETSSPEFPDVLMVWEPHGRWGPSGGPITATSYSHMLRNEYTSYIDQKSTLSEHDAEFLEQAASILAKGDKEISEVLGQFLLNQDVEDVPSYYELIWNRVAQLKQDQYRSALAEIRVNIAATNMPILEYFTLLEDAANNTETARKLDRERHKNDEWYSTNDPVHFVRFLITHYASQTPFSWRKVSLEAKQCSVIEAIGKGLAHTGSLVYEIDDDSCILIFERHEEYGGWVNPLCGKKVVQIRLPRDLFYLLVPPSKDGNATANLRKKLHGYCSSFLADPEDLAAYNPDSETLLLITETNTSMTYYDLATDLFREAMKMRQNRQSTSAPSSQSAPQVEKR